MVDRVTFTAAFHRFFTIFKKTFGLCLFVAVNTSFVAGDTQFVIQITYKWGVFSYVSDTKKRLVKESLGFLCSGYVKLNHKHLTQSSQRTQRGGRRTGRNTTGRECASDSRFQRFQGLKSFIRPLSQAVLTLDYKRFVSTSQMARERRG